MGEARLGGLGVVSARVGTEVPGELQQGLLGDLATGVPAEPPGPLGDGAAAVVAVCHDADAGEACRQRGDADDVEERLVEGLEVGDHGVGGVDEDEHVVCVGGRHGCW
jgi:hypothetical protein